MKHALHLTAALFAITLFAAPGLAEDKAKKEGGEFVSLFDGKTLKGWEGKKEFWSVEDGAITGQTTEKNPTKGNTFLIWRGGKLADFELRLKFRLTNHNSGIQYRSKELSDFVVSGYQADIDGSGKYIGILYEEKGRGILAQRGTKVVIGEDGKKKVTGKTDGEAAAKSVKKDDWNEYVITARGNHLVQTLNGHVTIDVTDNQEDKRSMKGILALQLHAGPAMKVQFKDIELKDLRAK